MNSNLSNIFGQSLNALSLSSPATVAGLAATGGVLGAMAAAAAVVVIHKKWEDYKEKEHRELVENINRIHKKYLERIESPDGTFLQGFPPVFKFAEDGKTVDSLHYNIDELRDIGTNPPHIESALSSYREDILDAIRELKGFYLGRKPKHYNDVTSAVLSYLLNILQNKCLGFEGYNNDIAYLDALTQFIDKYASMSGSKKTQLFSRIGPVYSCLQKAREKLERHQKSMPLRELVDNLRESSIVNSDKLLRLFIKMIIPTKVSDLGGLATYVHLREGVLSGEYIRTETRGKIVWAKDKQIELPDSIFKNWIIGLAKYYKRALVPTSILRKNNTIQPVDLFKFRQLSKNELNEQLKLIRVVFEHSPNYINTQLVNSEFVPVKNKREMIQRTEYLADFAHLVHAMISLQAFCAHLINSIDMLGTIYINDPHHFNTIFTRVEVLCDLIKSDLEKNRNNFLELFRAGKNTMRLAKEGVLPYDVEQAFKAIENMLDNLGERVSGYKNQPLGSSGASIKVAVTDILHVAEFFTDMYFPDANKSKSSHESTQDTDAPISLEPDISKVEPIEQIPQSSDSGMDKETSLNHLSHRISQKIREIKREQPIDPNATRYQTIWNTLRALHNKSLAMLGEKNIGEERKEKADKTYNLVRALHQKTLTFLSLSQEERFDRAEDWIQEIHDEINSPDNRVFIDTHRDSFSRFINNHFGLFQTATHRRFSELEHAIDTLEASLSPLF